MSADPHLLPPDVVRHNLALGLQFLDAVTGEALVAPLRAVIEKVGTRKVSLAMMPKAAGAALRLDAEVRRLFKGPANTTLAVQVLIAPVFGLGRSGLIPPDRRVIPRRILLGVQLDAFGLPCAKGPDPMGKTVFAVRLHRGPTFPRAAGDTALTGCLMRPGADPAPHRWAHVVAHQGSETGPVLGTTRCDDRGEFILRLQKRGVGQTPNRLREILVRLICHIPPSPTPATAWNSYDDLPVETLQAPDDAINRPFAGFHAHTGPLTALWPGTVETLTAPILA